jgi:glycosyltransferase involved in cell wall biosynthesis
VRRTGPIDLPRYPSVTIIVPCWNEEKTLRRTVLSLQALDYPKNKISLFLVDDGSTDGTWNVMKRFAKYSNILEKIILL